MCASFINEYFSFTRPHFTHYSPNSHNKKYLIEEFQVSTITDNNSNLIFKRFKRSSNPVYK